MELTFEGDLDEYFNQVDRLDFYFPVPPATAQRMATRPFGKVLEQRVKAVDAAQNYKGLVQESMARHGQVVCSGRRE